MTGVSQRLAVEIGGTFTDIIVLESGQSGPSLRSLKVPTTPHLLKQGVFDGVDQLSLDWQGLDDVMHGSTVATNAVLERKGVPAALLVTQGFQDILEIQRGDKTNIYDIFYRRPSPLIPRQWVLPVPERLDATGAVIRPLDEAAVAVLVSQLVTGGIGSVAICLLHSYLNPLHEQRIRTLIEAAAPDILVLTSSELLPQFREFERASTLAMSAYISPIMSSYLEDMIGEFNARGFNGNLFVTQSNGGVLPASAIRREVVRTLLSGPAAGVTGAVDAAARAGFTNIIAFDMGGTSTDVCLVNDGAPLVTTENTLNGLPVAVPMIDIATVGAGGGSIAYLDAHAMLHVGPRSAGADPGPACYSRGGELPTVTDADVVRGVIRAKHFAGGRLALDADASDRVLTTLGRKLGMSATDAADAVIRIVEANMTQAIRLVSTQRGYDPRAYVLLAFGGAGPIHAASIAAELGIRKVMVPALAGVLSAFGLLVADIARDYVQTAISPLDVVTPDEIKGRFAALSGRATAEFRGLGFDPRELIRFPSIDARYQGQAYELPLQVELASGDGAAIGARFHETHRRRYGFAFEAEPVEIVNYRLKVVIRRKSDGISPTRGGQGEVVEEEGEIRAGGKSRPARFYQGETLAADIVISGPAVIEEATSTCFVPEGWVARADETGGLLIENSST